MAKAKKTKKEKEVTIEDQSEKLQEIGNISITQEKYDDCEWCFQFDEDEPQVFAWTDELLNQKEDPKVIFTVTNGKNSFISFGKNDKTFKIFARELSDVGRELREKQREGLKNLNADMENFDQKMEEYGSENKEA